MNCIEAKYRSFALVREMMETPEIIANMDLSQTKEMAEKAAACGRLFFTGEGSSRIFPAKNTIYTALKTGVEIALATDGSWQSAEYDLAHWSVMGASNSGQTKEVISLFNKLTAEGHENCFAMTACEGSKLEEVANQTIVLRCGKENAVAATKSVVEQGLVSLSFLHHLNGLAIPLKETAQAGEAVLKAEYPAEMLAKLIESPMIYFAGRNNGVAEELTLKTNEITRKKSDFLEGTYLLHGIEEVMNPGETIVIIEPFEEECSKIQEVLVEKIGVHVFAIASKETIFPTITIPRVGVTSPFVQLMAGWNLLVQMGVAMGVDLDKPQRARKVGNAF